MIIIIKRERTNRDMRVDNEKYHANDGNVMMKTQYERCFAMDCKIRAKISECFFNQFAFSPIFQNIFFSHDAQDKTFM